MCLRISARQASLGVVGIVVIASLAGCSGASPASPLVNPLPIVTAISPASGVPGATMTVTLTGTHFVASSGTTVSVSGTGVTVARVTVESDISLSTLFVIDLAADPGSHAVTVTTSGGTSGAQTFTVNPPPPTLTSALTAAAGAVGSTVHETLNGTNFVVGTTTVAVSGLGVAVTNVSVTSSSALAAGAVVPARHAIVRPSTAGIGTSLSFDLVIDQTAALGDRTVTITTPGRTITGPTFTV